MHKVTDLLLHPNTQIAVEHFLKAPSQAICLTGPPGTGKLHLATLLAGQLVNQQAGNVRLLQTASGLGIDQIRQLQHFLKLKKPGDAAIKRVVIIDKAHQMTAEAQNALLKTLEEPPSDTVFILTSDGSSSLRPTIYSRVQKVIVNPVSQAAAERFFNQPASEVAKAYLLSGGYVGLMSALLSDHQHPLVKAVEQAKAIMKAPAFNRLLMIDDLAKQKDELPTLFYALQRVLQALASNRKQIAALKRLNQSQRLLYQAEQDLNLNANPKLILTDLFLNL